MIDIKKLDVSKLIKSNRESLLPDWKLLSLTKTDKKLKKESPEVYKKYAGGDVVELKQEFDDELIKLIDQRQSRRRYKLADLTIDELSYLLYSIGKLHSEGPGWSKRVIPTAGATHNLETYVYVTNVTDVKQGFYRYMPDSGNLERVRDIDHDTLDASLMNQLRNSSATVIWSSIPYRCEYKYSFASHKMIAIEAGHACQNLYLACEKLGLGTVAIGAYYQENLDKVLGFDGKEEFAIYVATIGRY